MNAIQVLLALSHPVRTACRTPGLMMKRHRKGRPIGPPIRRLSESPTSGHPGCSPDGQVWYFVDAASPTIINRCRDNECRKIGERGSYGVSVSPDGQRARFPDVASRGPRVGWISADGGATMMSSTGDGMRDWLGIEPDLWVSRRRDAKIVWTEVDADSGKETGQAVPGQRDCSDGGSDPLSPVNPDLRVDRQARIAAEVAAARLSEPSVRCAASPWKGARKSIASRREAMRNDSSSDVAASEAEAEAEDERSVTAVADEPAVTREARAGGPAGRPARGALSDRGGAREGRQRRRAARVRPACRQRSWRSRC